MSTIAAEVLDRSPYAAPEADLRMKGELLPDRLFSPEGRVGIWRYNARIFQGVLMLMAAAAIIGAGYFSGNDIALMISIVPGSVVGIAALAMMVYTSIKRLHDLNYSGWFYLIGIIPLVGVFWVLYYALKPGKDEGNRFGAMRDATQGDKIMGILGILFTLVITIASVIPESYYGL